MHVVPVDELRALARAVALDADLDVVLGEPGSGWFISPLEGVINADQADLSRGPADDVRGLVCHEASHAAVTRYLHLVPREVLRTLGISSLLNALEDCRIEEWLASRFPGTEAWIELYNDRLFPEGAEGLAEEPWFSQFCLGAIYEWWHGELPPLAPEVVAALEATREARGRYVAEQPPVTAEIDLDRASMYGHSRVASLFSSQDLFSPPDTFERAVRLSAYEAWRILWQEVRPIYLDLVAKDAEHAAQMKAAEQAFLKRLGELRFPAPLRGGRRRPVPLSDAAGRPILPGAIAMEADSRGVAPLDAELREAMRRIVDAPPDTVYETARRDVSALADRLFEELERLLRPQSYPQWVRGYPTGSRLDVRAAMAVEVEPGAYLRMWERKTLPHKRDPVFLLLLDLSGSMIGDKIEAGFRGAVLVAEVLERLGVPFAVYGFQDVLVPFKDFSEPLDAGMRARLGEMPSEVHGARPNGHNRPEHNWDGPVLERAASHLLDRPGNTRVMLVVSDGEPSGPSDGEQALHRAVHRLVTGTDLLLVGIGLGPGTEHVARYYPVHLASVPLPELPAALGGCIDDLLRR